MKIEIELSEVEHLKDKVKRLETENNELSTKLKDLSESELKKKSVALAQRLFDNYMGAVFNKLGFSTWRNESVIFNDNLEHWIGKSWWTKPESIKVKIEAHITNEFKSAFLSMGIIAKEKIEEENKDYKL